MKTRQIQKNKKTGCNYPIHLNIELILDQLLEQDDKYQKFISDYQIDHQQAKTQIAAFILQKLQSLSSALSPDEHDMTQKLFGANPNCRKFVLIINIQHGIGGDESLYFLQDYIEMHADHLDMLLKHPRLQHTNKKLVVNQIKHGTDYYLDITIDKIDFEFIAALIIFLFEGPNIRVQRKPINSTQMQTSTILLNVLLVNINKTNHEIKAELMQDKYIIWETFRASGAGGQHVNKTSSAVRLRHKLMPNIAIVSQQERNQVQNKKIALKKFEDEIHNNTMTIIKKVLANKHHNTSRNSKSTTYNYRRKQITHAEGPQQNFEMIKKDEYWGTILAHIIKKNK